MYTYVLLIKKGNSDNHLDKKKIKCTFYNTLYTYVSFCVLMYYLKNKESVYFATLYTYVYLCILMSYL